MKTLLAAPGFPFKVSKCLSQFFAKATMSTFWIGHAACPACHGLCGRSFLAGAEVSIGHLPFPGQHRKTSRAILIIVAFVNFGEIYTASVSTVMVPEPKAPVGIHVLLALVL